MANVNTFNPETDKITVIATGGSYTNIYDWCGRGNEVATTVVYRLQIKWIKERAVMQLIRNGKVVMWDYADTEKQYNAMIEEYSKKVA